MPATRRWSARSRTALRWRRDGIGNTTPRPRSPAHSLSRPAGAGLGRPRHRDSMRRESPARPKSFDSAPQLHAAHCSDPIQALRCLGGFEIVALAGSYLACAQHGLPVLVDGFVASTAAHWRLLDIVQSQRLVHFAHESPSRATSGSWRASMLSRCCTSGCVSVRAAARPAIPLLRLALCCTGAWRHSRSAGVSQGAPSAANFCSSTCSVMGKAKAALDSEAAPTIRLTALGMEQMWAAVSGKGRWNASSLSPLRRCAEFARVRWRGVWSCRWRSTTACVRFTSEHGKR